jgi:hypothetical protein
MKIFDWILPTISLCLISGYAHSETGSNIEMWTRRAGDYRVPGVIEPINKIKVDLDKVLANKPVKLFDLQYKKTFIYKAVALSQLISQYKKLPSYVDTAILQFDNGMHIPVPLSEFSRINAFIARKILVNGKFVSDFPELSKQDEERRDPRPLKFVGNKLVVSKSWHPSNQLEGKDAFTPWLFTSAIVGIEFVNEQAYFNQFLSKNSSAESVGSDIFKQRCQFCHSVIGVGARYGWDFVDPLPIYKQKTVQNLLYHVKYPKWDALQRGLMMPAQKDISENEAQKLWNWMKIMAEEKLQSYKPE